MPTRTSECSRCPLTQTLWCDGSSTYKSFLSGPAWTDSTWLCLPLLRLLRDASAVGGSWRVTCGVTFWTPSQWLTWCKTNKHPELNLKQSKRNDTHTLTHQDIHTLSNVTLTITSLTHTCDCHWHPPTNRSWLVHLHDDIMSFATLPTINQLSIRQPPYPSIIDKTLNWYLLLIKHRS